MNYNIFYDTCNAIKEVFNWLLNTGIKCIGSLLCLSIYVCTLFSLFLAPYTCLLFYTTNPFTSEESIGWIISTIICGLVGALGYMVVSPFIINYLEGKSMDEAKKEISIRNNAESFLLIVFGFIIGVSIMSLGIIIWWFTYAI